MHNLMFVLVLIGLFLYIKIVTWLQGLVLSPQALELSWNINISKMVYRSYRYMYCKHYENFIFITNLCLQIAFDNN